MQKHLVQYVFNRGLVLQRNFTFFHIRKRALEEACSGRTGCTNTTDEFSINLKMLSLHSSVAQVLRLGLLESRDKVQEACEVWGKLPQTSYDWSDIPEGEEVTYED